jgi:hypothetical protein
MFEGKRKEGRKKEEELERKKETERKVCMREDRGRDKSVRGRNISYGCEH